MSKLLLLYLTKYSTKQILLNIIQFNISCLASDYNIWPMNKTQIILRAIFPYFNFFYENLEADIIKTIIAIK